MFIFFNQIVEFLQINMKWSSWFVYVLDVLQLKLCLFFKYQLEVFNKNVRCRQYRRKGEGSFEYNLVVLLMIFNSQLFFVWTFFFAEIVLAVVSRVFFIYMAQRTRIVFFRLFAFQYFYGYECKIYKYINLRFNNCNRIF